MTPQTILRRLRRSAHASADIARSGAEALASPRAKPARIGLLVLIDLVQDHEVLAPVVERARRDDRFEVRVVATDWLDIAAPGMAQQMRRAGWRPLRVMRRLLETGLAPNLDHWNALLTGSESTALPHRFAHALTMRANLLGLETFTLQHGLENIGLTYNGDGPAGFASRHILTWGSPEHLPAWVDPDVRARCIGAGRPLANRPFAPLPIAHTQRPIVAVFENLHWGRYDGDYRAAFLANLRSAAEAFPNALFVVRPHPAGQWLSANAGALANAPANLQIVSAHDPLWRELGARDLIASAAAIITTPSTIALDAALQNKPVAIVAQNLDVSFYAPLPALTDFHHWRAFLSEAFGAAIDPRPAAFAAKHLLDCDAPAAILDVIGARARASSRQRPDLRAQVGAHAIKAIRALPSPIASLFPSRLFERGAIHPLGYQRWIARYDTLSSADLDAMRAMLQTWTAPPRISIILDVSAGDNAATRSALNAQVLAPEEIIPCGGPGGLSFADALASAKGDHVMIADAGDTYPPHALLTLAHALNAAPGAVFAYGDEDWLDSAGRRASPFFKPDWSRDLFIANAYAVRPALIRMHAAKAARASQEDPQAARFELMLKLTERGEPAAHAPWILCHRQRADDAASLARAATAACAAGESVETSARGVRRIIRTLTHPPLVSVIIPTRDRIDLLRRCVDGVLHKTDYPAIDLIIADNQSSDPETLAYFAEISADDRVRVLKYPYPFNFAAINNHAAAAARGEMLVLLNNDIAITGPAWLTEMVSLARRDDVGAVGALLTYPDGRIQHAGCVLGIGGVAAHLYRGWPPEADAPGGRLEAVQDVSAVSAACLITRHDVWDAAGGMDERFPVAFNDIDYCLRLRAAGQKVLWTPFARLEHHESATRGGDRDHARRDRLDADKTRMRMRWGAALLADPFYNPNLSLAGAEGGLAFPPRVVPYWRTGG